MQKAAKSKGYDHQKIDKIWQKKWLNEKLYSPNVEKNINPFYSLWMFPYPSAEGLHAGHAFASTGSDVYSRYMRMNGKSVFQPIGYDSFGIHSENYALKIGENPEIMLRRTTAHYEDQLKSLGHGFDWTRTVTTSDVSYYKWTEWLFVTLFKAGLAYKKRAEVNFCPGCKTVLADEQVMSPKSAGKEAKDSSGNVVDPSSPGYEELKICERCGTISEKKELEQWFFRITSYAQKLLDNLSKIDWSERVKLSQKEWIGKSTGLTIDFEVATDLVTGGSDPQISRVRPHSRQSSTSVVVSVWTKFWETIYGTTFLVVSPEYARDRLMSLVPKARQKSVSEYIEKSLKKSSSERADIKEKSGVLMGIEVKNPVNGTSVPVFVADYVLSGVGTGAVMGVPAHDERDFAFAKKYGLDIIQVVAYEDKEINAKVAAKECAHEGEGTLTNSGEFDGLDAWGEGKQKLADWMIKDGFARWETSYHLRDWLISRQRYWGCPIPMIYCEKCAGAGKGYLSSQPKGRTLALESWNSSGWYPVQEEELPVVLPHITDWKPEGTGKGPLANHPDYYNVKCPGCGADAKRETDVADTFLDSSWYFLRYPSVTSVTSDTKPFDPEITKKWLPVNLYFGGAEHSVLHLMYARFITMALNDLGYLSFEEPFPRFFAHGLMIKDGAKMSKSRGNVVNPDEYVAKFGADAMRLYLMFMGPMDGYPDFRDTGIEGMRRFVDRLWVIFTKKSASDNRDAELDAKMHKTIKGVTDDIEKFSYNTAIAKIMEYVNLIKEKQTFERSYLEVLVKLIAPFAPHLAEEAYQRFFAKGSTFSSIHVQKWPEYNPKFLIEKSMTIALQINGKLRSTIEVSSGLSKEEVIKFAKSDLRVRPLISDKKVIKEIYVEGRLVNFVV